MIVAICQRVMLWVEAVLLRGFLSVARGEIVLSFGERFARLSKQYRRSDGSEWTPTEIQDATSGFVNLSYLSNLQAGRIRKPGLDKLRAIASAMGFPWQLWLEEPDDWERISGEQEGRGADLAGLLKHLLSVVENFRTGRPFTTREVAQLSEGRLSEEQVKGIRDGEIDNPTFEQVLALSDVFGVDPGYWFASRSESAKLDRKTLEALKDPNVQLILQKSLDVSTRDRSMILMLIEHLSEE